MVLVLDWELLEENQRGFRARKNKIRTNFEKKKHVLKQERK